MASSAPAVRRLVAGHAAKADVARARVDGLRAARRRAVAHAVAVGAQEGAALDGAAGDPELRLGWIVTLVQSDAARVAWHTARLAGRLGMAGGVPVRGPLPHVA